MAVLFAPPDPSGSAGIGASMGKSIQKTLEMLTQGKIQQQQQQQAMMFQQQMMQQQQQKKAFDISQGLASMGVPEELSEKISRMPEGQQSMFLNQFFGSQAFAQPGEGVSGHLEAGQRRVEETGKLEELLGAPMETETEGAPGEPLTAPQAPGVPSGPEPDIAAITKQVQEKVAGMSPEDKKTLKAEIAKETSMSKLSPAKQREERAIPAGASREAKPGYRLQAKPAAKKSFAELLATPRPTLADKAKARAEIAKEKAADLAERKFTEKKQKAINNETKGFYDSTMKAAKAARENDMRLSRMTDLLDKGNLNAPTTYSLLERINKGIFKVGFNFKGALLSDDSQVFEKLTADFTKGVKDVFGSRVTTTEVELFMKTVPNLTQSHRGKREVIRNWKILNKAATVKKKAMADIIAMNGGNRPKNLALLVDKKVGPQLDKLSARFAKGDKRKDPRGVLGTLWHLLD